MDGSSDRAFSNTIECLVMTTIPTNCYHLQEEKQHVQHCFSPWKSETSPRDLRDVVLFPWLLGKHDTGGAGRENAAPRSLER